jgi:hypothetical protein
MADMKTAELFPDMVDIVACDAKGQNPYPMKVLPANVIALSYFEGAILQLHFVDGSSVYCLEEAPDQSPVEK